MRGSSDQVVRSQEERYNRGGRVGRGERGDRGERPHDRKHNSPDYNKYRAGGKRNASP